MQKIKKGDLVIVTTGRDKGKLGKVSQILRATKRLVVEGVNIVKKHVKPDPNKGERGGIKEIESTIHASNVALYNAETKKADKVKIKKLEDGRQVRVYKSNEELVDI